MTHFVGLVVADSPEEVSRLLAPYDEDGRVGYVTTYNPQSRWDWYVVGGRWSGSVPGSRCLGREVRDHFREYLPAVLVDAAGWHASREFGWFGTSSETGDPDAVAKKLEEHADRTVYVVDFHGA